MNSRDSASELEGFGSGVFFPEAYQRKCVAKKIWAINRDTNVERVFATYRGAFAGVS